MNSPLRTLLRHALVLALAAVAPVAWGQTFTVTVGTQTAANPNATSYPEVFYIDGVENAELHLTRGVTYTFVMDNVPAMHPFYISTDSQGGGRGVYGEGVTGNFATGTQTLTFTPTASTPDLLYYQCNAHLNMGWRIYVSDPLPALALETVAEGFTAPVGMAMVPGGDGAFTVVDQIGVVHWVSAAGEVSETPYLDVRDRMLAVNAGYDERGLLGLAFHPDYATNGRVYVYYSAPLRDGAPEDYNHTARVSEFTVSSDPEMAEPTSERVLLEVDEPQFNHNAGMLAFGPDDGYLYVSFGDGGAADDNALGHVDDWYAVNAGGNGQDVEASFLGSILRLDVDGGDPYGVPEDNPFVGRDGLDEIYAYGFRNPWRYSFDAGGDHDLIVADVGQNLWEEVSVVTAGGNYGWNVWEGTHCFSTDTPDESRASCPSTVGSGHPDEGAPLLAPVLEYPHPGIADGLGLAVVAGYVYRGTAIPDLAGRYVFADWSDSFGEPSGQLFVAEPRESGLWSFGPAPLPGAPDGTLDRYVLSFGQDAAGEVYVLTTENAGPSGETGRVSRLVLAGGTASEPGVGPGEEAHIAAVFPNPTVGATTVRYVLPEAGDVVLEVSDLLGRRVQRLAVGTVTAGPHEAVVGMRSLPAGVYVVRLLVDGTPTAERRVVLAR